MTSNPSQSMVDVTGYETLALAGKVTWFGRMIGYFPLGQPTSTRHYRRWSLATNVYDTTFFDEQRSGSAQSASVIVPLVLKLFQVRSVIDVGCGVGPWLRAFSDRGVTDITGLDGDYVDRAKLEIPAEMFHATDLKTDFPIARRYDLACSLEVAEHLPANAGPGFIAKLCKAAPVVLFSAAIPSQGGTDHINEMWQDAWRQRFAHHGYCPVDAIRWQVWGRAEVEWWYQQNMVVYVDALTLAGHPDLQAIDDAVSLNVVHPNCYAQQVEAATIYFSKAIKQLPGLFHEAVRRRVGLGRKT